jgi:hypothetical protein
MTLANGEEVSFYSEGEAFGQLPCCICGEMIVQGKRVSGCVRGTFFQNVLDRMNGKRERALENRRHAHYNCLPASFRLNWELGDGY